MPNKQAINYIANKLGLNENQISATIDLLIYGATIPFIARYRKEATGNLNEVEITAISEEYNKYNELEHRKEFITKAIYAAGGLTEQLQKRIAETTDANEIEDIYLPFKQKRKTRATIAKEAGLEPLAKIIMSGKSQKIEREAKHFVNNEIKDIESAIKGACDIIAEWVSESETARNITRRSFAKTATIHSCVIKGKEDEGKIYADYFNKEYRLSKCPSHALLAMRRGEKEKILRVEILTDDNETLTRLYNLFIKPGSTTITLIKEAVTDGYKRLLRPSIETEFATQSKADADNVAIDIFAQNLKQLLLAAPVGQKRTLAIDPGFKTGCKIVCLDSQGNLIKTDNIYPHPPQNEKDKAIAKLQELVKQYDIEIIAIGNGTAGRETEDIVKNINFDHTIQYYMVNENGASIYSASEIAREEFPNYDITVRGAVSIGRRLMDPLAELVKIDPKSIGVGQYQHDVDQNRLKQTLDRVVTSCVNQVGVEVNIASKQLLTYVSGIGPKLAQNIIEYRAKNGNFKSRKELLNVPLMGPKSFQQCAGFIRVNMSNNPLDHSAVHPETYHIVEQMARDCKVSTTELIKNHELQRQIILEKYITDTVGLPTLNDIMSELEKPGRDPRKKENIKIFDPNIRNITDLNIGMIITGQITNITNFGAFVDLGIKENALLHISQISEQRISSPAEILHLHQTIQVKIINLDLDRKRISVSMKNI